MLATVPVPRKRAHFRTRNKSLKFRPHSPSGSGPIACDCGCRGSWDIAQVGNRISKGLYAGRQWANRCANNEQPFASIVDIWATPRKVGLAVHTKACQEKGQIPPCILSENAGFWLHGAGGKGVRVVSDQGVRSISRVQKTQRKEWSRGGRHEAMRPLSVARLTHPLHRGFERRLWT